MQTGQIAQPWVKFAINVDVKIILKVSVARIPYFRRRSKLCGRKQVNEIKQDPTVSANSAKSVSDNSSKTVPKQVVDIIDIINHGQSSGENLRRTLELDTLSTTS